MLVVRWVDRLGRKYADVTEVIRQFMARGVVNKTVINKMTFDGATQDPMQKAVDALIALNPRADFEHPGQQIVVADVKALNLHAGRDTFEAAPANIDDEAASESVATIVVDKPARNVRAYDKEGKLLAYYPATIGSEEKPAPSGAFKVRGVSWNPDYIYDPKFAWKGVNVRHKLTIRPGPNNPVGLVWIDLTAPTYGIHGTPEPADIGKTESQGCIRLTNWNAVDLAAMVRPGTIVKFEDEDTPVAPLPGPMSERRGLEINRRQP